ncbi:MAG TPA: Arc family DNA-binding protein [Gammaproteobacteria bacterium]|nr:Arc family DNA-binding protein [Gammaproteobacteria bacterium]
MASVVIKNLPDDLHRALKQQAERHHRSLNKELISIIESAMHKPARTSLPEPVHLRKPLTAEMLDEARREGRA